MGVIRTITAADGLPPAYHGATVEDMGGGVLIRRSATPALQAQLDAENTAREADMTARQQFIARCAALADKARDHAAAPASNPALTTRELNEAIAKLFRIAANLANGA